MCITIDLCGTSFTFFISKNVLYIQLLCDGICFGEPKRFVCQYTHIFIFFVESKLLKSTRHSSVLHGENDENAMTLHIKTRHQNIQPPSIHPYYTPIYADITIKPIILCMDKIFVECISYLLAPATASHHHALTKRSKQIAPKAPQRQRRL